MKKHEVAVNLVRSQWPSADEAEREKILEELKEMGFSIIDSIRTLREADVFALGDAKAYISSSQTWQAEAKRNEFLHEQAWRVLDEWPIRDQL
jgi:hypothetical protein